MVFQSASVARLTIIKYQHSSKPSTLAAVVQPLLNLKKIIYIAAFLIVSFLVGFTIWKDKVYTDTVSKDERVTVKIINVVCTSGKGQSSLYFRDQQYKVNHVNVNHQDCNKYKEGDLVTLLYNKEQDWYFVKPD